jgi:hypothetical protein
MKHPLYLPMKVVFNKKNAENKVFFEQIAQLMKTVSIHFFLDIVRWKQFEESKLEERFEKGMD